MTSLSNFRVMKQKIRKCGPVKVEICKLFQIWPSLKIFVIVKKKALFL